MASLPASGLVLLQRLWVMRPPYLTKMKTIFSNAVACSFCVTTYGTEFVFQLHTCISHTHIHTRLHMHQKKELSVFKWQSKMNVALLTCWKRTLRPPNTQMTFRQTNSCFSINVVFIPRWLLLPKQFRNGSTTSQNPQSDTPCLWSKKQTEPLSIKFHLCPLSHRQLKADKMHILRSLLF